MLEESTGGRWLTRGWEAPSPIVLLLCSQLKQPRVRGRPCCGGRPNTELNEVLWDSLPPSVPPPMLTFSIDRGYGRRDVHDAGRRRTELRGTLSLSSSTLCGGVPSARGLITRGQTFGGVKSYSGHREISLHKPKDKPRSHCATNPCVVGLGAALGAVGCSREGGFDLRTYRTKRFVVLVGWCLWCDRARARRERCGRRRARKICSSAGRRQKTYPFFFSSIASPSTLPIQSIALPPCSSSDGPSVMRMGMPLGFSAIS